MKVVQVVQLQLIMGNANTQGMMKRIEVNVIAALSWFNKKQKMRG